MTAVASRKTGYVWLMTLSGAMAHAVDEGIQLRNGRAPTWCSPHRPFYFDLSNDGEDPKCPNCVSAVADTCGTYSGYQKHRKHGTRICQPCRKANAAYHAARRAANPELRKVDRRGDAARERARRRLSEEFPERYRELLAEERAK